MLERVTPTHCRLTGQVNIRNSASLLKALFGMLPAANGSASGSVFLLDVAAVESADSVLLAAILELARRVEVAGGTLKVLGLSEGLQGLARVYGVDALIASYTVTA